MKKLLLILTSLILISCSSHPKYKIKGQVYIPCAGYSCMHDAIWYTDTIYFLGDTACYDNSDGSIVKISPPYEIKKN